MVESKKHEVRNRGRFIKSCGAGQIIFVSCFIIAAVTINLEINVLTWVRFTK